MQVVEAALTTALTDRPYSRPPTAYGGLLAGAGGGQESPGAAPPAGVPVPMPLSAAAPAAPGGGVEGEEEDDGLAEVDFRDQYDDFA